MASGGCFSQKPNPALPPPARGHDPLVRGQPRRFYLRRLPAVRRGRRRGLAAYGEFASHTAQREKEAELLFRGEQIRNAIASYYRKEQRYPQALAELLEDKRFPMPVRHLRRLYRDPMSGETDWGLVEAPGGAGVMGVHSRSEDAADQKRKFFSAERGIREGDQVCGLEVRA